MPSLKTQLQWCDATRQELTQYREECIEVANNIDAMMKDLETTFFEELYVPVANIYPSFQQSTRELFEDIEHIELPYIDKQIDAIMTIIGQIKPV